ncbi:hypothetical protein PQR12_31095 [Paraburkholderia nemoris]|uniref:hypothetical protein n=1 Tax=Paraburkholderia nemoris TaxID=2793076 RepID=UPI0038BCEA83
MNAISNLPLAKQEVPTVFGTPWEGGYFAGIITFGGDVFAQVVAPKADGDLDLAIWHHDYKLIAGTDSFFDGLANTQAMAEAGSAIAQQVLELRIAGFDDWHIGARDQVELLYRGFKPTTEENYVYRSGDNPSSLPVGYPYSIHLPGQTPVELFREGGAEAFEDTRYWTSTQYSAYDAWFQDFAGGGQGAGYEGSKGRVRAVRRVKIS